MIKSESPLRYPGGKSQFYSNTLKIINDNSLCDYTYIEPFAGGAGVALKLLFENKVKRVILNDYDPAIYAFWYSVINLNDQFINLINQTPITVDEWILQKQRYNSSQDFLTLGFATFFLNRCNRSGIITSNPIGGKNQNGNYKLDCRFNKQDLINRVRKISSYKKRITIFNLDAEEFIKLHRNRRKTFWFIDPPYYLQGSNLYKNHYNHANHLSLKTTIYENLSSKKWILTYDKCKDIKIIYKRKHNVIIKLKYSVETKRIAEEYLFYKNLKVDL